MAIHKGWCACGDCELVRASENALRTLEESVREQMKIPEHVGAAALWLCRIDWIRECIAKAPDGRIVKVFVDAALAEAKALVGKKE